MQKSQNFQTIKIILLKFTIQSKIIDNVIKLFRCFKTKHLKKNRNKKIKTQQKNKTV